MKNAFRLSGRTSVFHPKLKVRSKNPKPMSNSTDYQDLLSEIQANPDKEILHSDMPVNVFNQETKNFYYWGIGNKDKLAARGLEEITILDLLNSANFDLTLMDEAAKLSVVLPGILASVNGDKADDSRVKKIRDYANTYPKRRVEKVASLYSWKIKAKKRGIFSAIKTGLTGRIKIDLPDME